MYQDDADRRHEAREHLRGSADHASLRLLRTVTGSCDQSGQVAREMRRLASGFEAVGNGSVAGRLHSWADEIEDLAELVWDAHAVNQLHMTQEHSGNMLRLALGLVSTREPAAG